MHPCLGKIQSVESNKKRSISNTGKVRTQEMKMRYSESRKKMLKEQGGLKTETKEKISQVISDKIQSGEFNPFGSCRKIIHKSEKCKNSYNTIRLKSSFEKTACIILDNDPDCISYTYEPIQIKYKCSQETNKIYIPDFIAEYSNNIIKLLEIKPIIIMQNYKDNLIKQEAAIEYCKEIGYIYEFWNEKTMNIEGRGYIQYDENFYDTYEEFKEAVKKLKIRNSMEYRRRYKEDPKLPSHPAHVYPMFNNWYETLEKNKKEIYDTYEEASKAAQQLNIKNKSEYFKRYKEDPKLHCAPDEKYRGKGWIDYYHFLGTNRIYYSYEEAKEVVKKLKFKKLEEYKKQYKIDDMLPSKPERIYQENWVGWKSFLN